MMAHRDTFNEIVQRVSKDFTVENDVYKGQITHNLNESPGKMLWTSIKKNGDNIAYLDACTEETLTYAELQDKVVRCALWLQKQAIKSDDIVTVCTNNHLTSIVPCISTVYINAILNTWNENMDLQTTLYFLQLIMPKVIFCNEKSADVILRAIKEKNCNPVVVVFGKCDGAISFSDILRNCNDAEVANFRYVEVDGLKNKTSCILHSSGTTGMSKGVELSNYFMALSIQEKHLHVTDEATLWFSSLYWISGIMMNFNSIKCGSKMILYPEFDEEMICRLMDKYKIGTVLLSTSMIHRFVKAGYIKKYSLLSLKNIITGGATLKPEIQAELKCILPHIQVKHSYGMTEIGGIATMQSPNHKNGSCGTVVDNIQIKIVDPESGKVLGPNQSGELWIKSTGMMNGYYKNPEATKNTIDEDGWLHSGDIGYMDEDGELFIIDKIKELMKYRGYQISPGEIEKVLMSHPAVLETAVIGVPHELDDEHPLAFVTKKSGAKVTEQELIDFVAKNMMDQYKLRAGVIILDRFPYTDKTSKISRKDLKIMMKKLKHID